MEMENINTLNETLQTDNRSNSVKALERQLLKTTWVKEAELIQRFVPEEDLTKTQQKLLVKCIDKEEFTEKQLIDLKLLLNKYRKILQEINPEETIEAVENSVQMIQTEADFIRMMSSDEKQRLLVHITTYEGKKVGFDFIVEPLRDSRVVETLEMQVDLFRDYSADEQLVYGKASMGQELSLEEQHIYQKMQKEILEKQSTERISTMNTFLANQLTLENSNSTLEERIRFWELFPFTSKVSVFIRVQDMLGLSETSNRELFPTRQ